MLITGDEGGGGNWRMLYYIGLGVWVGVCTADRCP
jgi:hypothetical protein